MYVRACVRACVPVCVPHGVVSGHGFINFYGFLLLNKKQIIKRAIHIQSWETTDLIIYKEHGNLTY